MGKPHHTCEDTMFRRRLSNAATRANVGSHKVKLPTTTAITPLPLGRERKFCCQRLVFKSDVTPRKPLRPSHTNVLFLLLSSFISRQAVQDSRSRYEQGVMEAKRWHWDSPDTNYVRYILLVIILDLSMGLFVSFAAVCPTWVHISFDSTMHLSVVLSNDHWTENWTYGGKWDKWFNIWIKYEHC